MALDQVKDVEIDTGTFKYILIKVHYSPENQKETSKFIVRGSASCEYHGDIYDEVLPKIEKIKNLECEVMGGGRIFHDEKNKTIKVYGYSQGYGKADHSITTELLTKNFDGYEITWSDAGY